MTGIDRSPQQPALDASDLQWLIEQWFAWLEANAGDGEFAIETIRAYEAKLSYFCKWWASVGESYRWRLDQRTMQSYEVHLRSLASERTGKPLAYNTRFKSLQRLRQMFNWAYEQGYTPAANYSFLVPAAKGSSPRRKSATLDDLKKLLNVAAYSSDPIRDMALIVFFVGTGCRREETAALRIEEVAFTSGFAGIATIHGKRTRSNPDGLREVSFDAYTGEYLSVLIGEVKEGPVFISRTGDGLTGWGIYKIVKRLIAQAGLADKIQACHDLRRAFAHHITVANPGPAAATMLQRQLGHAHYSQTAEYTLIDAADMVDKIVNPLSVKKFT